MRYCRNLFITSLAVFGSFGTLPLYAALKPTGFPQTFQDVPFTQRMEIKKAGYEPYKDLKAYVIPDFKDTDEKFKNQLCERDRVECCRRWPDYKGKTFSCQPRITYHKFGGTIDSNQKSACPEIYYTDRGATVSCIPTRDHSEFKGWCIDATRKNCAMTQIIPVGDKDNKDFYALWDCVSPTIPKGDQCACPDSNMDENCECNGTGMTEDLSTNKCVCIANTDPSSPVAVIQNKNCVCIDSAMDINTNCTTPINPPSSCSDEDHMDSDCNCLPIGKASPDLNGKCQCIDGSGNVDPSLDIDNNCEPQATPPTGKEYYIKQCRQKPGSGVCKNNNKENISDCFMQCKSKYNRHNKQFFLNNKIKRLVGSDAADFCSGSSEKGPHLFEFRDPATKSIKYYDEATANAIFAAIRDGSTPGEVAPPFSACETSTNNWVLTLFKYDSSTGASTKIDEIQIGN